ncbi:CBS domain-containing protein [Massilia atriviolacea]|nr:CBS domain-containing protein [Massilia atriviolacea]
MPTIQEVMSRDVQHVSPEDSVHRAAQIMKEFNIGSLPVVDGDKLVGMITDRDITVRSTAAGKAPETSRVGDAMSTEVRTCYATQSVDDVLTQMGDVQIRRVPVVDQQSHSLVGIVSLGDMATKQTSGIGQALQEISSPTDGAAKAK